MVLRKTTCTLEDKYEEEIKEFKMLLGMERKKKKEKERGLKSII